MGAGEVLLKFAPCSVLTRIACPHHPRWQSTRGGAPRTSLGTSNQCTHPAHKLTKWHAHPWPPGHTAWPTSTPYAVCVRQCVGSVCVTPCACFAGSPHTASSATPWAALRGDIKGQALPWVSLCTHAHTHAHAHGVARDAQIHPISTFDVLHGLLVLHSLLMCMHRHANCSG